MISQKNSVLIFEPRIFLNKTPKVVSVGCIGLWKHNSVLSDLEKFIGKPPERCDMLISIPCMGWFNVLMTEGWS